ncbi:MAG: ROK family protein [Caldilineaceae bacterium]
MNYLLGIDIGGTKCAVTLGLQQAATGTAADTTDLQILAKAAFATPFNAPEATLEQIVQTSQALARQQQLTMQGIAAIGISCGGPLDSRRGLILSPPNLIGWDAVPIVDNLEKQLGRRPTLQNDANACAVAEWKYGAGRGLQNVIFLTFGTGMGAGLILNGQLYSGTNDMAGEVGHIRLETTGPVGYGKAGSFEGFCSGGGIAQLAVTMVREKLQRGEKVAFCASPDELATIDARIVGEFAEAGDPLAQAIYQRSGQYLGRGLAILIDILNPEAIVIGSIFARRMALLWAAASAVIEQEALGLSRKVCRVLPAALGEQIGDYAALAVAAYGLETK